MGGQGEGSGGKGGGKWGERGGKWGFGTPLSTPSLKLRYNHNYSPTCDVAV